jgi:uncharacterized damage-inducible protein DinB
MVLRTIRDLPDEMLTHQPSSVNNHVLWTLGHLAVTDDWLAGILMGDASVLPPEYSKLFGYGSRVEPTADAYPPVSEVRLHFMEMRERLMLWLGSIDESQLGAPVDDGGAGFAANVADAIGKTIWHDGWHAGQLSTIRRSLGMESAFTG